MPDKQKFVWNKKLAHVFLRGTSATRIKIKSLGLREQATTTWKASKMESFFIIVNSYKSCLILLENSPS